MIELFVGIYVFGILVYAFGCGIAMEMYTGLDYVKPKTIDRILRHAIIWPVMTAFVLGAVAWDIYRNFNPKADF